MAESSPADAESSPAGETAASRRERLAQLFGEDSAAKIAERLNSMQSSNKPSWASNMENAKYKTICALYCAAHDMEADKRPP